MPRHYRVNRVFDSLEVSGRKERRSVCVEESARRKKSVNQTHSDEEPENRRYTPEAQVIINHLYKQIDRN